MRAGKGFSLIELLIVVAIILIIAAIAVPRFLQSRIVSNEASAIASCRTIVSAEITYNSLYKGYSASLAELGPPAAGVITSATTAGLIDEILTAGSKSGYAFNYVPLNSTPSTGPTNFSLNANPEAPGQTGIRYFFSDGSGVIRQNIGAAASATASPLD
ncbi:MAG: prepilin-type N-terminal cleavage/methylation domain-containing protein [Acidobacteria bacterium]|nr:prepilin-type N-terminal cleavage/methylation domain-containing protein [Acidobacteriota bacterium]